MTRGLYPAPDDEEPPVSVSAAAASLPRADTPRRVGRCKDCEHWKDNATITEPWTLRIPLLKGWGECEKAQGESWKASDPATLAFAQDWEEYGALLTTHPDFGCVMFQPKEPPS